MPGHRTCPGGAYTFQIPGPLAAQDNVAIPLKVQNPASIRCVYGYLQQGASDGQSAYVVKYSTDGGATWNVLDERKGRQPVLRDFFKRWASRRAYPRRSRTPGTSSWRRATASRKRAACRTTTTAWSPSRRSPVAAWRRRWRQLPMTDRRADLVPGDFVFNALSTLAPP